MTKTKCIICGGDHIEELPANFAPFLIERMFLKHNQETSMIYCPNCDFYFSKYRPTDEELQRLYKGYRGEEYQTQREKHEPFYTKEFNESLGFSLEAIVDRKHAMTQIFKSFINSVNIETLLDWGGDAGQYIPEYFNRAKKFVFDISGIETLDNVTLITNSDSLNNYEWDLILCCHVLEHVTNPESMVNEILSLMKEGSYLYVEVPNEKYAEEYRLYGDKNYPTYIHEHINLFTCNTLENLFSRDDVIILENTINIQGNISCLVKKVVNKSDEYLILNNMRKQYLKQLCVMEYKNKKNKKLGLFPQIFSICNEGKHKVLRFLGIKLKIKRR